MRFFDDLCKDNYERIYKYIYVMIGDKTNAEDITQEVFLVAYKKGMGFIRHENPTAFLYKTAKNLTCEYLRSKRKIREVDIDKEIIATKDKDIFETLSAIRDKNLNEEDYIDKVFEFLTDEERLLYSEYYLENKTMKEIAKSRSVSEVSIRMKYVRLRREVRNIIKQFKLNEI